MSHLPALNPVSSSPTAYPEIIEWDEAMLQCGEDEEFLRELLGDLRNETQHQVSIIETILQTPPAPADQPFEQVMRSAHLVKGAAANLMCGQLRLASMALETAARECHSQGGPHASLPLQHAVQAHYADFVQASHNYCQFLQVVGI